MNAVSSTGFTQGAQSLRSPQVAIVDSGDRRWKHLTEQANTAYRQGDIPLAHAAYEDALTEAERLFAVALSRQVRFPAPVIYNVSCHNIAELCAAADRSQDASVYYRRAYDRLLEAAHSPETPLDLRISCVQHLKHALAVLVQHLSTNNSEEQLIGEIIDQAHKTAYSVFRIAQHARHADEDCPHCPITIS